MANPFANELAEKLAGTESADTTDRAEAIEFTNDAQRACYAKVEEYGRQLFGEMFERSTDPKRPTFYMDFGSANIFVSVKPWANDKVMVNIGSWVIQGADITEDLMDFLLRRSFEKRFGAFGLEEEDDILYYHRLAGENLDKEELKASIQAVAYASDEFDEIIKSRWGGRRFRDSS